MTKFSHVTNSHLFLDTYQATKYISDFFSNLLVVLIDEFGHIFRHCFSNLLLLNSHLFSH